MIDIQLISRRFNILQEVFPGIAVHAGECARVPRSTPQISHAVECMQALHQGVH